MPAYFSARLRHEYVVHGILKHPNVCEICKTPYQSHHTKCTNLDQKKSKEKPKVTCDICGKSLNSRQKLRLHKISLHGIGRDDKAHICEFCNKSFGADLTLKGSKYVCGNLIPHLKILIYS